MGRCWRGVRAVCHLSLEPAGGSGPGPGEGKWGGGARCCRDGTRGGQGGGTSAVWGMCGSADGRVTAMWVDGGGPGPVGTTGAGGWSDRTGGAFSPARATRTTAQAITGWGVRWRGGGGDHDEGTAVRAVGGGPGPVGKARAGVESGRAGCAWLFLSQSASAE